MATLPIPLLRRLNFMQAPSTIVPDLSTPVIPAFAPPPLGTDAAAPVFPAPTMSQPLPQLPPLPVPNVAVAPPAPVAAPPAPAVTTLDIGPVGPIGQLEDRYSNLALSRPGVEQIRNPLLRGLGRAGDVLLGAVTPGLAARLPSTTLHHDVLVSQAAQDVNQARKDELEAAQAAHFANLATATRAGTDPVLAYARMGMHPPAAPGLPPTPMTKEELGLQQQSLIDYRNMLGDPDAFQNQIKQQKLDLAVKEFQNKLNRQPTEDELKQMRVDIAAQTAGLRQQANLAHFYGTDAYGNPLPGAMLLPDNTPVGTVVQQNVRPTTGQRDAAGRALTAEQIGTRLLDQLNDPEIQKYVGPGAGRLAELMGRAGTLPPKVAEFATNLNSLAAFMAGQHPVRGLGGLQYFDEIMGGLGQSSEQLQGRIHAALDTARLVQALGTPRVATGAGVARPAAPPTAGGVSPDITQHDPIIDDALTQHPSVDKNMVYALIQGESGGDPTARGRDAQGRIVPGGGVGVMQLTPSTADRLGVTDRTDPAQNIPGGIARFDEALTRHDGDPRLAAADYFHGPQAIRDGEIVDPEARRYADNFMRRYHTLNRRPAPATAAAGASPSAAVPGPAPAPTAPAGGGSRVRTYNPQTGRLD
jgi:hypothetical protein